MSDLELKDIQDAAQFLTGRVYETPVFQANPEWIKQNIGDNTEVFMKCELFQKSKSFKARGTFLAVEALTPEKRKKGVVACSGGNFALAVATVAKEYQIPATVVMPSHVSKVRSQGCEALGAKVILESDITQVFDRAKAIEKEEGKTFLHPFEGPAMTLGSAVMTQEYLRQCPNLDLLIAAIGGGGMASGVGLAVQKIAPQKRVFGVEPEGANTMHLSFEKNAPQRISKVTTIADSLGAPQAEAYSLKICQETLSGLAYVSDEEMKRAMRDLFRYHSFAVEPACAAGIASLFGNLRKQARGKKVGVILCGSNIDIDRFRDLVSS